MTRIRIAVAAVFGATALLLPACASGPASQADAPPGYSLGSLTPGLPDDEVIGQGTVMDVAGTVELCLGPVAESYPPQCSGIPLTDWTWDGVEGAESSGDVRWGAYAVQGIYDGATFAVTQPPILLALYDPRAPEDPFDGEPGDADEATLMEIQDQLPERLGAAYLSSWPQNGRLWVQVVWDDGTWQSAADDDFGVGVVVIQPALRPVG